EGAEGRMPGVKKVTRWSAGTAEALALQLAKSLRRRCRTRKTPSLKPAEKNLIPLINPQHPTIVRDVQPPVGDDHALLAEAAVGGSVGGAHRRIVPQRRAGARIERAHAAGAGVVQHVV